MTRRPYLALALFVVLPLGGALAVAFTPPAPAEPAPAAQPMPALPSLAPMLREVKPAVVNVFTRGLAPQQNHPILSDPLFRHFFNLPNPSRQQTTQSLGSGVIFSAEQGLIVTNAHVIADAREIAVTLHDGRVLNAEVVGTDEATDLAVIRVPAGGLRELPAGDSAQLEVGDYVVAIGNPFGLGQTVTSGIVSAIGRSGLGIEAYEDFIQTDAPINPGNSGGALVNLRGELVGINTAIYAPNGGSVGIGFAIPVNVARRIVQDLVHHGEFRRGELGIEAQDLTVELARAFGLDRPQGAVITRVRAGRPAAQAGLLPGDVILAIDERPIRNANEARNQIGLLRLGERVSMEVLRDGERRKVTLEVAEPQRVMRSGGTVHPRLRGARLQEVEESTARGSVGLLSVVDIEKGSPAAATGLLPGDLILAVNRQPVHTLEELAQAMRAGQILMNISRAGQPLMLLFRG